MRRIQPKMNQFHLLCQNGEAEKLPPLGFVPLLLSRYLKKAAAGSSASHQPRTTSSDHSTDDGNTHVTHRHHDSSGVTSTHLGCPGRDGECASVTGRYRGRAAN
jgi:hypothetical protein